MFVNRLLRLLQYGGETTIKARLFTLFMFIHLSVSWVRPSFRFIDLPDWHFQWSAFGCQTGASPKPYVSLSLVCALPSEFIIQFSPLLGRLRRKRMCLPSGDQVAPQLPCLSLVRLVFPEPSAFMIQMSLNSNWLGSGV